MLTREKGKCANIKKLRGFVSRILCVSLWFHTSSTFSAVVCTSKLQTRKSTIHRIMLVCVCVSSHVYLSNPEYSTRGLGHTMALRRCAVATLLVFLACVAHCETQSNNDIIITRMVNPAEGFLWVMMLVSWFK